MRILEAILAGERNPEALARLCSTRIKASRQTVAKSLHGNWREELLFALRVAMDSYRFAQSKIAECDERIGQHLAQFEDRAVLDTPPASLKSELHRICGVDLTKIPGIKEQAAREIYYFRSRPGHDPVEYRETVRLVSRTLPEQLHQWRQSAASFHAQEFQSRRCPAAMLTSSTNSKTALGAKYRRLKGHLGRVPKPWRRHGPSSRLPREVYRMLRYGRHYVEKGMAEYEIKFRLQRLKWVRREAKSLDMQLLPADHQ